MKIELASSYGFCFGVKRAIKIAENAGDAATIGPLIHNNEEINRLEKNYNVKTLEGIGELKDEKKAIIRTHGITKNDLAELKKTDIKVIDATCPFVTKPQQICEKMSEEGYDVVICSKALIDVFDGLDLPNTKVIGLQNLLSEKEITEKLAENGIGA